LDELSVKNLAFLKFFDNSLDDIFRIFNGGNFYSLINGEVIQTKITSSGIEELRNFIATIILPTYNVDEDIVVHI